ncbi:hypothetical protein CB1_000327067 [Camelus ferus]|nr:hypothetical protein CB1_000327067 [Camelus ferus]
MTKFFLDKETTLIHDFFQSLILDRSHGTSEAAAWEGTGGTSSLAQCLELPICIRVSRDSAAGGGGDGKVQDIGSLQLRISLHWINTITCIRFTSQHRPMARPQLGGVDSDTAATSSCYHRASDTAEPARQSMCQRHMPPDGWLSSAQDWTPSARHRRCPGAAPPTKTAALQRPLAVSRDDPRLVELRWTVTTAPTPSHPRWKEPPGAGAQNRGRQGLSELQGPGSTGAERYCRGSHWGDNGRAWLARSIREGGQIGAPGLVLGRHQMRFCALPS